MFKNGFGINNLQLLICHKTKQNQINLSSDVLPDLLFLPHAIRKGPTLKMERKLSQALSKNKCPILQIQTAYLWIQSYNKNSVLAPVFDKKHLKKIERYISHNVVNLARNMKTIALIIFTNPSARAGCDIRSIFKRSLTGLNSEFSFS